MSGLFAVWLLLSIVDIVCVVSPEGKNGDYVFNYDGLFFFVQLLDSVQMLNQEFFDAN